MNINKMDRRWPWRSGIVVRLWLIMMLLVILSIAFMWVVQIFLFERNYVDSTAEEVQSRLQPLIRKVKATKLTDHDQLLSTLSKSTNGKMMIIDVKGKLLALYSLGYRLQDENSLESINEFLSYLVKSDEYQKVFRGISYHKIIQYSSEPLALEIGIPVIYENQRALIVLYHSMDQLNTVLSINRGQLLTLSIVLSLAAAILAALLSRHFMKPIRRIKGTIDKLTKGELSATPGLSRGDELGQLSDSVDALSQALRRVDILRKEVIANVSHELRSPLALIRGYAEMVRDINWENEDKRNDNLNLIIQEAGRMSEMVSDILDYSQLQAGYIQLKKSWYNLNEIVASEVAHCEPNAAEYGITMELEITPKENPVYVDAMKICQVMRNLLNNAINHTAYGGRISIVVEKSNQRVRVSVINPGIPIPKEDLTIIWERYQRSQHHGGRKKGTGIGLSIVSTFLNAHDMQYGVESKEDLTTFWFEY